MSAAEAEAVFRALEQELVVQRARRAAAASRGALPSSTKWLLLMLALFLLLGVILGGFWLATSHLRAGDLGVPAKQSVPTSVPKK
ncbi:MAG: hypothetical protein JSR82_13255 [Verrucomicrobia bacterium]|nr:hypothetical protein [Verrucomicrobiota bacterium]